MFTAADIQSIHRKVSLVIKRNTRDVVPELITERLFTKGTYSDGTPIITYHASPPYNYSSATVAIKSKAGQPTDRVTLKDTGAFYGSIMLTYDTEGFTIHGDTDKFSDSVDPKGVLDLTTADMDTLRGIILEDLRDEIKKSLDL